MKTRFLVLASISLIALLSVPAFAEDSDAVIKTAYSSDALALANILKNCASEVGVLSQMGPENAIASASHEAVNDLDTYTVEFEAGGLAPSFRRYSVGTLVIARTFVPSFIHAPDAPGGHFEFHCQIIKPTGQ